jgi:hypothetical protein
MIDAASPAPADAGGPFAGRERPAVDVVVPFVGSADEHRDLASRLSRLVLRVGDTVTIADNRAAPQGPPAGSSTIRLLAARGVATPGFARNRGAAAGVAPWIVFLDADTTPEPELLDRYFEPAPAADTGLIGGAVIDEPVAADAPAAARYAYLSGASGQARSLGLGSWAYPKSANIACRREAFERIGGFREGLRAGEDADLSYRLSAAGWRMEQRGGAVVVHRSRATVPSLVRQKLIWGAGGADLNRLYPGSVPPRRRPGLVRWALRAGIRDLRRARRSRDHDATILAVLEPLEVLALEFGRSLPNERPLTAGAWLRAARRLVGPGQRRRD